MQQAPHALKTVQFSVAREVALGESVRVVGSGEALGEWDAHRGVQLQWSEGHVWRASAALPAESKVSFKFVKLSQDGGFVEWEEGEDRTVALLDIAEPAVELLAAWEEPGVVSGVEELRGAVCADADEAQPTFNKAAPVDQAQVGHYVVNVAIQKQLQIGETLKLVGNALALGAWCHHDAPAFTWTPDDIWQISAELPLEELTEFKIVVAAEAHGDTSWCIWQEGENTILDPRALGLQGGAQLEVGCDWEGESRAQVAAPLAAAAAAAQQPLLEALQAAETSAAAAAAPAERDQGVTASPATASAEKFAGASQSIPEPAAPEDVASVAEQRIEPIEATQEDAPAPAPQEALAAAATQPDAASQLNAAKDDASDEAEAVAAPELAAETESVAAIEVSSVEPVAALVSETASTSGAAAPEPEEEDGSESALDLAADLALPEAPVEPQPTPSPAPEPEPEPEPAKPWVVAGTERAQRAGAQANVIYDPKSETWTFAVVNSPSDSDGGQEWTASADAGATFSSRPSGGGSRMIAPVATAPVGSTSAVPADAAAPTGIAAMVDQAQIDGVGLEQVVFTPEQLDALTNASSVGDLSLGSAALEAGTIKLAKGRLDTADDGSTVVVRGGHEYDADTDTVTARSATPDGLLVDADGESLEEDYVAPGEAQPSETKEGSGAAGVAGGLGALGAVAGMAAAGLGGAALAGGLAVDVTDLTVVAGLYGMAQAVASSRSDAVREKGAAGPLFSVLYTAADIAKKVRIGNAHGAKAAALGSEPAANKLGRYAKSDKADQSARGGAPRAAVAAAPLAKSAAPKDAARDARVVSMQRQLGAAGMQALEDGVAQVMEADVSRILKALKPGMSEEAKVLHLVRLLLDGDDAAASGGALDVDVRAALQLAQRHVEKPAAAGAAAGERAPAVLLAALALSAVRELKGGKA